MASEQSQQEQDVAAGGAACRALRLEDGTIAIVSVAVRQFATTPNQQYGYLQFKVNNKTVTKYIGRVTADSKQESLGIGWALLRQRKLVEANGWAWVKKPGR